MYGEKCSECKCKTCSNNECAARNCLLCANKAFGGQQDVYPTLVCAQYTAEVKQEV